MSTLNILLLSSRSKTKFPKLLTFASLPGAMINPQWLKLPISRTNFHGPKDVGAIEVWLYFRYFFPFYLWFFFSPILPLFFPFLFVLLTLFSISLDACHGDSVGCTSDWWSGHWVDPHQVRQHSFVETEHEIFSTVILSLPLIQEGQLSVSG